MDKLFTIAGFTIAAVPIGIIIWVLIELFILDPLREKRLDAEYLKSDYYNITGRPRNQLSKHDGTKNEYEIYRELKDIPGHKRFLFNCSIPSIGHNAETEIDVLMVNAHGLFVFESKDYAGEISGHIDEHTWTQTLGSERNPTFNNLYNPVRQNKLHIDSLNKMFPRFAGRTVSYIIFSDRSRLNINGRMPANTSIRHTNGIQKALSWWLTHPVAFSEAEIEAVYQTLLPRCKRYCAA